MNDRLVTKLQSAFCPGQDLKAKVRPSEAFSGQSLVSQGLISEDQLAKGIAEDLQIEYWKSSEGLGKELVSGLTSNTLKKMGCLPVKKDSKTLTVAFVDPYNLEALSFWEAKFALPVKRMVITLTGFNNALLGLGLKDDLIVASKSESNDKIEFLSLDGNVEDNSALREGSDGAEIIRLVNDTLLSAIRKGASDIHIEPTDDKILVRYRIDGTLREQIQYERIKHPSVVVRLKLLAEMDISERRKPQDGRLAMRFDDRQVDMRISTLPSANGEKIVLRILNDGSAPATLEMLGFRAETHEQIERLLHQPQGMFLVTGPTGSGKSSTLRSGLHKIVSPTLNIITIENPIEYRVPGVNQVQVNERAGLTFSGALRSMLRQDPNVIMIGEIRDAETAEIAFKAATTGHLVLSTLHTNDAPSALTRLLGLNVPRDILAAALSGILAQRLLRKVCKACCKLDTTLENDPQLSRLGLPVGLKLMKPVGCKECGNTGFKGRRAIEEFLVVSEAMRQAIEGGESIHAIRMLARKEGMTTLVESGIRVLQDQQSTLDEVLRVVGDAPNYSGNNNTVENAELSRNSNQILPIINTEPDTAKESGVSSASGIIAEITTSNKLTFSDNPLRVMVVEDDKVCRKIIIKMLQKLPMQMEIQEADSAEAAQNALKQYYPELLFTDVCMPGSDGFEFLDWFREQSQFKHTPVVLTTAIPEKVGRERGLMTGADGYLQKPYKLEALEKIITRLVKRSRP